MIDIFYFSIANHKRNDVIDDLIQGFIDADYISSQDKLILKHALTVGSAGTYPTAEYFYSFYEKPAYVYRSLSEIITYTKEVHDFYKKQSIQSSLIKAINDSNTSADLIQNVSVVVDITDSDSDVDIDGFKPVLYSDSEGKPEVKGCNFGIPEIDQITNGVQPGNIASIAAFTGHGKSTMMVSLLFKNAHEGKKCCLMSIEVAPEIVWAQLQARYLYEVKGIQINAQDLLQKKLTKEAASKVKECDDDFKNEICSNIKILDETVLSKSIVTNYKALSKLFRTVDKSLGGLDIVAWDHVGQLELLFPNCGNEIIKQIQSSTKTFITSNGNKIVTLFAVQANREGEKRARKRSGVYDMQAIADLNEVERSSSYIMFMYTSDDMKVVQETKVDLKKHRFGAVSTEPITTSFNPSVCIVGSTIEQISVDDDTFNGMESIDFDDDEF